MSLNYTKFIDACVKNDKETVKVLIEQKKHYINQTIITGDTGLHIAASRNYKDLCLMLIQYGVDLNIKNNCGKTALMKAILKGNTEIVDLLLKEEMNLTSFVVAFHRSVICLFLYLILRFV